MQANIVNSIFCGREIQSKNDIYACWQFCLHLYYICTCTCIIEWHWSIQYVYVRSPKFLIFVSVNQTMTDLNKTHRYSRHFNSHNPNQIRFQVFKWFWMTIQIIKMKNDYREFVKVMNIFIIHMFKSLCVINVAKCLFQAANKFIIDYK